MENRGNQPNDPGRNGEFHGRFILGGMDDLVIRGDGALLGGKTLQRKVVFGQQKRALYQLFLNSGDKLLLHHRQETQVVDCVRGGEKTYGSRPEATSRAS